METVGLALPSSDGGGGAEVLTRYLDELFYQLCVHACMLSAQSCRLFATPWTVAHQPPLSVGFFRQEYWSGLPFPPPGDLPGPGTELGPPALRLDSTI